MGSKVSGSGSGSGSGTNTSTGTGAGGGGATGNGADGSGKRVKLYELIAVKASLRQQAKATMDDLGNTFLKKQHHFEARLKTYDPDDENSGQVTEDHSDLQTTVRKELAWVSEFIVKALDVSYQAAIGDTEAFGDIVLEDGETVAEHVPSIMLLELEDRLDQIKSLVTKIPTLDPAKGFAPDPAREDGVYVSREVVKRRTAMKSRPIVLYDATPQHPAQTQIVNEQTEVGTIREREWSSMLTPADKGNLLDRVEKLARAVKRARSRANETEVDTSKRLGGAIVRYLFGIER